ncbi:MAG TPA: DUF3253 domain-containing protein [Cyclobacteriaceae bacterium]|jgi:hypothetical protein|nr:DUF3253 domain-containing protein [Cyclobacteriaceae bacterium]
MQYAEDIRKTILKVAEECGPEKTFVPADVARKIDKDNWPGLIQQVVFVAEVMFKEGKLRLTKPNGQVHYRKV